MADSANIIFARFWSKADVGSANDCWLWRGRKNEKGYGLFGDEGAHRVSYRLEHGSIPDGLFVMHLCDIPACVNPRHLTVGTVTDNNRDCRTKGRAVNVTGERHGRSKLTDEQVAVIRAHTGRMRDLAERFGVSPSTISYIRSRKRRVVVGDAGVEPAASSVSRKRSPTELIARFPQVSRKDPS